MYLMPNTDMNRTDMNRNETGRCEYAVCDSARWSSLHLSALNHHNQSLLHYIRTLPMYPNGILLLGTFCSFSPMWEMNKKTQINITHERTPIDTHSTSNESCTHKAWEQQAPVKRRTSVRDCEKTVAHINIFPKRSQTLSPTNPPTNHPC